MVVFLFLGGGAIELLFDIDPAFDVIILQWRIGRRKFRKVLWKACLEHERHRIVVLFWPKVGVACPLKRIFVRAVGQHHVVQTDPTGDEPFWFGGFMDIALVVAAASISITYLIEIDSVCLIDALNGERARIMAQTLLAEIEFAELMGLPVPDTVDDPKCVSTTGVWLVAIMGISILIFLGYNIKV